jgi:hypothetical protein
MQVRQRVRDKETDLQKFLVIKSHGREHGAGLFRRSHKTCEPLVRIIEKKSHCVETTSYV